MKLFWRALRYAFRHPGLVGLTLFSLLGFAAFQSFPFLLLKELIGWVQRGRDSETAQLYRWLLLLLGCLLLRGYFDFRRAVWIAKTTETVRLDVLNGALRHLLGLSVGFFERQRTGQTIATLLADIQSIPRTLNMFLAVLRDFFPLVALLATLFLLEWRLALLGVVGLPLLVVPLLWLGRRITRAERRSREHRGDYADQLLQLFSGIRIIKSFECEEPAQRTFAATVRQMFKESMRQNRARAASRPLAEGIMGVGALLGVVVGLWWVRDASIPFETWATFLLALATMERPLKRMITTYNDFRQELAGLDRAFGLLDASPEVVEAPGAKPLPPFSAAIRYEGVHFAYPGGEPVIRGVSVEIKKGERMGLAGPTASGKSTLVDLLCRFHDVGSGRITIDGHDLREVTAHSLFSQLALVTQQPILFNTTIRENIRLGRPGATDAEVEQAAQVANIHQEILALPTGRGYDSLCGEGGALLSGGQRQRIALARAVLKGAPILILDEATSALDAAAERVVQEGIENAVRNRTSLEIAHRLSTIRHCDRIIVLREGTIEKIGPHEELLHTSPTYARMWRIQQGLEDERERIS